ncbi:MAG: mycofactocin-coupled SDR family oxidoreductase [Ilumatobacteraceae bacterium]
MGTLDGRVAFITGAARGQGRAHAVRLAAEGADVIGLDLCGELPVPTRASTPDDLAETARQVERAGGAMHAEVGDVRSLDDLERVVRAGVERFGRLDIVVANAGILGTGLTWELSEREFQDVIDTNLVGVWKTLRVTVPILIEQGTGGSIILVSSVAGLRGLPFFSHYSAAKHGVVGLCRSLANELGAHDIRVNSIHPAGVRTEMVAANERFDELLARFSDTLGPIFMNALPYDVIEPEQVAEVVAFLASDAARFTTGAQIPIDLGTLTR